jgi:zinc/manganese transport system substrate-binding protein
MRIFSTVVMFVLLLSMAGEGARAESGELKVVASFSILADFAQRVGGDRAAVTSLVGPDSDAHIYEPTPKDVQKVAAADVIVVNGLGLEGWLGRLREASGTKAVVAEASAGIAVMTREDDHGENGHEHGARDPHAFQSIGNAIIYVENIAKAFCEAAPHDCDVFSANAAAYTRELTALDREVRGAVARIPAEKRRIITSHDAFGYFAREYGISFLAPEGVSTESEASAADVAKLIEQIKAQRASALFVENISDNRLIEQIARETGLRLSGVLFSDALSGADGPAASYIEMMRHNVRTIVGAISEAS